MGFGQDMVLTCNNSRELMRFQSSIFVINDVLTEVDVYTVTTISLMNKSGMG